MTTTFIQPAFMNGELSPKLWGRVDLAAFHSGASTARNFFVDYRGGLTRRFGTQFVGVCKQMPPAAPPRDIRFQFNIYQNYALEFGDNYMRVKANGAYVLEATKAITAATQALPCRITSNAHGFANGDWVFITGVVGMVQLNQGTFIVAGAAANNFTLTDVFGVPVNATGFGAYVSGGTVSRYFTLVTPYAAVDLPYLKFTQSANIMSLCCVNTVTNVEYPPQELTRITASSWTLASVNVGANIVPPTSASVATSAIGTWDYQYAVTAVDAATGQESIATSTNVVLSVNNATTAATLTVTWAAVAGAGSYNVYRAPLGNGVLPVPGALYGYVGSARGLSLLDSNITPDFSKAPPLHLNPFARGQILAVVGTAVGAGYSVAPLTITTATGSGFVGQAIIQGGGVIAYVIVNPGQNYKPGDTATVGGDGAAATVALTIGPQSGTYPGCATYFQGRRGYAATLNNPDTYFFSKPGAYTNFDAALPPAPDDSISGTPWGVQVNGIQAMVPMPSGLVLLTGKGAWQLSGGAASAAITPAVQDAQPQAFNGCSATVPPQTIDYDILYVQSRGSIVRDLSYNFFVNIYTGVDLTQLSSHLFVGHQILQWAWQEEPYKVMWCVREDGVLLSLTYLKTEKIQGWARHDTKGQYQGVCTVSEARRQTALTTGNLDFVYFIVKRLVNGRYVYYSERMDDGAYNTIDGCWFVDAGLQYPQTFPAATLFPAAATGSGVVFTADSAVFSAGNVGNVIRGGGGIATVTAYDALSGGTRVICDIGTPLVNTTPDDLAATPLPIVAGQWTITAPTSTVTGLGHLEGQRVSIVADQGVLADQTVVNGTVTLAVPASAIVVGLAYQSQFQSVYFDAGGGATVQGKRKTIYAVVARVEGSRGLQLQANQIDGSATTPQVIAPNWGTMIEAKERSSLVPAGVPLPLFTGDIRVAIPSTWRRQGQIALECDSPMPCNLVALEPDIEIGDSNG